MEPSHDDVMRGPSTRPTDQNPKKAPPFPERLTRLLIYGNELYTLRKARLNAGNMPPEPTLSQEAQICVSHGVYHWQPPDTYTHSSPRRHSCTHQTTKIEDFSWSPLELSHDAAAKTPRALPLRHRGSSAGPPRARGRSCRRPPGKPYRSIAFGSHRR